MTGTIAEIWLTPAAAQPMRRVNSGRLLAGAGVEGDRYALGGGTWARYPLLEKQVTLIDRDQVAAVAAELGAPLRPGDMRRNLVTVGIDLPALVGRWFAVGEALLFGMKLCPPCRHLERLTGTELVRAMASRGGINAAIFAGAPIREGSPVAALTDAEAADRGAPTGADRPVPRAVG